MFFLKNLVLNGFVNINTADGVNWDINPENPVEYLTLVAQGIIGLAGLVAVAFIVFGAYTLITSGGDPENITKGQKMITNAVIGLIIAALAFMIVNFVILETPEAQY